MADFANEISNDAFAFGSNDINTMLKTYYAKEGVENLLYRNDPLLKMIKKEQVEGKTANFTALYSKGGAVAANYIKMKNLSLNGLKAAEFAVTPGQLFSGCVFDAKEIAASKSMRGAYINIAQAKFFAATESFRKTLAVALYGTGYGEIYQLDGTETTTIGTSSSGSTTFTLPQYAVMSLDVGSSLDFCSALGTVSDTAVVEKIDGTSVTVGKGTGVTLSSGNYVCLSGCSNGTGKPLLPMGLAGWLPKSITSANDSFFGVTRSTARDRLAGTYIQALATDPVTGSAEAKYATIQRGILALRRMGSLCDMIVMNDEDYAAMAREIENKTTFQKVDGGKKGKATVGYSGFGFAVSTNWLDNVIDSPYCPKGTAYILSSDTVQLWTFSNTSKIADGIVDNEPGKPDVTADDPSALPYKLLVDNLISVQPGQESIDGPATLASLNFYGSFVITNPSVNGVVTLN